MKYERDTRMDQLSKRRARENANLFGRLSAAAAASRTDAQRILKTVCDLSVVEWRVLWDLYETGPLTVRDIALIQRADHSLISRALPALQQKGFVVRSRDGSDKRQTVVELTPLGCHAFEQAAPAMKARRERLRAAFGMKDLTQFIALIERFESFLEHENTRRDSQGAPSL